MSTEIFKAKSRAKLTELALQSRAIVAGKNERLHQENRSASQESASEANATKNLSIILNYVLDLSDYAGTSNVLSNSCIV